MESSNFVKNIISKDKNIFDNAINELVYSTNTTNFEKLDQASSFIFPFVKEKIITSFVKLINKENLINVFNLMKYYSYDFEDMIVNSLLKNANEDLTDTLLEKFEKGSQEEKTYCAKYFSKINDPLALEPLRKNALSDFYYLKINSAIALANFKDDEIVDEMRETILIDDDEFKKLNALEFLIGYGNNVDFVLENTFNSPLKENIVTTLLDFNDFDYLYNHNKSKLAQIFNVLIDGYPESIDLNTIQFYEISKFIKYLISDNSNYSKALLLIAKTKFNEFIENDNYTYDLDKFLKDELKNIQNLLKEVTADGFEVIYNNTKPYEFEAILNVIKDYKIGFDELIELVNQNKLSSTNAISALEILKNNNFINKIDKKIIDNIEDNNLKAIAASFFAN